MNEGVQEKRELLCEICGREYEVWSAENRLWNAVMRGGERGGDERYNFVCASCFMVEAAQMCVATMFGVTAGPLPPDPDSTLEADLSALQAAAVDSLLRAESTCPPDNEVRGAVSGALLGGRSSEDYVREIRDEGWPDTERQP